MRGDKRGSGKMDYVKRGISSHIRQGGNKKEIAGRQKLKIEFGKMQSFV